VGAYFFTSGSFTGKNWSIGDCIKSALRKFFPLLLFSIAYGMIIFIGLMLFFIPGLLFMVWYSVGAPALLVENLSWSQALARSKELTDGHRWQVFALIIIVSLLVGGVSVMVDGIAKAMLGTGIAASTIDYVVRVILGMVSIVTPVALYFHLRVVKEAFDVETLSSLVDAIAAKGQAGT
jgi:hypothetical protein